MTLRERQTLRAENSLPALTDLHDWLHQTRLRSAPNTATAKAIDYTLKRWPALTRYAETGDLPIDNNPVENAIRPIALGKKNWLFAGSERAGQRAAVIQTLLGTAKLISRWKYNASLRLMCHWTRLVLVLLYISCLHSIK